MTTTSTYDSSSISSADPGEKVDELLNQILEKGGTLSLAKGLTEEEIEAIYTISYNLYQQSKFKQAEQTFSFLCLYSHLDVRFWMGLGASREALGKYSAAIDAYSHSALLQHDDPIAPLHAAKCYLALDDLDHAKQGLTAAIHWSENKAEHWSVFASAESLLNIVNEKTSGERT